MIKILWPSTAIKGFDPDRLKLSCCRVAAPRLARWWAGGSGHGHEPTLDQFFTEEQFEVYRALGFHAARCFFTGTDRFALRVGTAEEDWANRVRRSLKPLDLPAASICKIVARQILGLGSR